MMGVKIVGTGSAVPSRVVTNDDLAQIVDTSDEWISTRTGIRSRRYVDAEAGESHRTLVRDAAQRALGAAKHCARAGGRVPGGHLHGRYLHNLLPHACFRPI